MKNKKVCLLIVLICLFIINTILVKINFYAELDDAMHTFLVMRTSEMTTTIMKCITFLGSTLFIISIGLVIFVIYLLLKRNRYAYVTASLLIISTVINNVVKLIIRRARPIYMSVVENSFSYPSGHMMASTTLYGLLLYYIIKSNFPKKYKVIYSFVLATLIVAIGTSRMYLGAHYFSDILGAFLASTSILLSFDIVNEKKTIINFE